MLNKYESNNGIREVNIMTVKELKDFLNTCDDNAIIYRIDESYEEQDVKVTEVYKTIIGEVTIK